LRDRNLGRRFLHLALLNLLANLAVPLAGLVDTAMLGHLDAIRFLAGAALAGALFDFLYWSFGFLRMATTGTTAMAMGRGDDKAVDRILERSLALALGLAALVLLLQNPLENLGFRFLAGGPEVEMAGREYFRARIWGAPAVLANLVFLGWFLGRGESGVALRMTLAAALGNIALDYVFILELGLAARGAGAATALSQYLMLAVALAAWRGRRGPTPWDWRRILQPEALLRMLRLQGDLFLRTLCLVGAMALFTNGSAALGTLVLAANSLLLRLLTASAYFIDGIAYATETLAGQLHGAGRAEDLRWLLRRSLLYAQGIACLFALALFGVPDALLGLLTSHGDVIARAVALSPWLVATLLLGASAYIFDGYFLGLAAGPTLRRAMLQATLGVYLPLLGIALFYSNAHLLWLAMAVFTAARSLLLARQVPASMPGAPP
jgi:MATE family multidrug resistance protein